MSNMYTHVPSSVHHHHRHL